MQLEDAVARSEHAIATLREERDILHSELERLRNSLQVTRFLLSTDSRDPSSQIVCSACLTPLLLTLISPSICASFSCFRK